MRRDSFRILSAALLFLGLSACDSSRGPSANVEPVPAPATEPAASRRANPYEGTLTPVLWPGERHLANVRQLTFAGENAEAYWSADGRRLVFQSTRPPHRCDQIFVVDVDAPGEPRLASTGKGRTTCAYWLPDGERILYSSTHLGGRECPPQPDMSNGYTWALYPEYDVFTARPDGTDVRRLTATPGYDAEATVSTDGRRIVFTSVRDGDIDLYSMNADGGDVRRLTRTLGYDGGAFYSDDGAWIVYRASRPETPQAVEDFRSLLARQLVRPSRLEIRVMRADGSNDRQVTAFGVASFAPFFFRGSHERLLFVSNLADPKGRDFDIWAVDADGTDLERITYNPTFDGFPMLSPDGRRLAFCSNRHNAKPNETNVFVADWVP
jgi:Tol biopolymer transport system component